MGFEYNFKITKKDIDCLASEVDGIDGLDALFRLAPHFLDSDGSTYSYSGEPENADRWSSNIAIQDFGFRLCIYDRTPGSADMALMNFLLHELLGRCGRLEVEDE